MSGARKLSILAVVAAIVFAVPASAQEPNYPTRPIKIIVSVPAGGGSGASIRQTKPSGL